MKIDILAIGAHPDDVELGCSGTIAKEIANNKKVGILDLTKGELGTRGSASQCIHILNQFVMSDMPFTNFMPNYLFWCWNT